MNQLIPFDPFVEVAMALYDAIVRDRWRNYTREQFAGACKLLKEMLPKAYVSDKKIGIAFVELEKLGFDVFPFNV